MPGKSPKPSLKPPASAASNTTRGAASPAPPAAVAPSLKAAGLVYVNDTLPGLTRLKSGKGFRYRNASGQAIKDPDEIRRIQKLAIPPAYTRVWICPVPNGHLQATGYDARGRKQYRYHADWQDRRNDSKFERLQAFGRALPRIRARVARDLAPRRNAPVSRSLVLATLVRLLDTTFVRVGNDEYARDNGSYGLTTLRNPHAGVRGKTLQLRFRGKSGVMQDLKVDDPKVAAVVRRCQQLPGQLLFQYEAEGEEGGEGNQLRAVGSGDVNDYLAEITRGKNTGSDPSDHFTAKDFRTWHGTVQALELTRLACSTNGAEDARPRGYSAKAVLQEVARLLGNTPAVCKKSYIHPAVLALGGSLAQVAGAMVELWPQLESGKKLRRLYAAEHRLMGFLDKNQRALKTQARASGKASVRAQGKAVAKASRKTKPAG
ncbi:MAG: DNA topoisomerase IB [Polaromonas sp.]|nr:DNA topoisomerase IB [Polaromonas sp.]